MLKSTALKQAALRLLMTVVAASLLQACGQSSVDSTSDPIQSSEFQLNDIYQSIVLDALQPESIDRASAAVYEARLVINNLYFDNLATAQTEPTPIVDGFDCDSGTVTRAQSGNPVVRDDVYEFSNCRLLNKTHDGKVSLSISNIFCNGPIFNLTFDSYKINDIGFSAILSGEVSYISGAKNCSSGAGGPPGAYAVLNASFSHIETTFDESFITYTDLHLNNERSDVNNLQADNRLKLSVETQAQLHGHTLRLTVSTPTSILISDGPEIANSGSLVISLGDDNSSAIESLSYSIPACNKDMVTIDYTSNASGSKESVLIWSDEKNLLNRVTAPSVLTISTIDQPSTFTDYWLVPYSDIQNVDGC